MIAPVHMVGETPMRLKIGREVRTRCGLVATPVDLITEAKYKMVSESGGDFLATALKKSVTCKKCRNLLDIGMLHAREER